MPELKAETYPVDAWHEHVECHQIRMELIEAVHRLARVGDGSHLVSGLSEYGADQLRHVPVVVDHEDASPERRRACGRSNFLVKHV